MTVAYLVNQYPHVSHTFIRREIGALEAHGLEIARISVRPPPKDLIDPADIHEVAKTHVVLAAGAWKLMTSAMIMLMLRPVRWLRALRAALRLGRRSERGMWRHLIYLVEACSIVNHLERIKATRLHAHFGTNPATVAMLIRILGGPPFSFTVHGPEEFDKPEALSLGEKIAMADFVVAISSFGRSQLCRWSQPDQWNKIRIVHCGLDEAFLIGQTSPVPDVQRLVCVGRLCEQKGQLALIEAAAMLRRQISHLEIVLAGDGPMRGILENRIASLELKDIVRITGWVTNDQVRDLIKTSRALVLPSFAEGLPVVLMEAMALGRPTVTTYIAGIPELVKPSENGWLVPAGSTSELANAIAEVLATPVSRLSELGANGSSAVQRQHSAKIEAAKLAKEFRGS